MDSFKNDSKYWHRPEKPTGVGLLLTHGAGADANAPLLLTLAEACCQAGVTVVRYNLPFRQRKAGGPPHPSTAAVDRQGLREILTALRVAAPGAINAAGHSYGGRQLSMLAAEDPTVADRLILLSYPLHPPAKPDRLRTQHFPQLRTPTLFVSGTRDDFGTPAEFRAATAAIPAPVEFQWVEGAGHDLKRGNFDLTEILLRLSLKQ